MADTLAVPEGFIYQDDFVLPDEEADILHRLESLTFQQVRMKGVVARRSVIHYGWDYGYDSWKIQPADPIPVFMLSLRERCAAAAGLSFDAFGQLLVSRYPPGAGIGWHRDAPMFGPIVAGVSLLAPCRLRMRAGTQNARRTLSFDLAARSLYLLTGKARSVWQHSITPVPSLRYSLTFRQVGAPRPLAPGLPPLREAPTH